MAEVFSLKLSLNPLHGGSVHEQNHVGLSREGGSEASGAGVGVPASPLSLSFHHLTCAVLSTVRCPSVFT